MNSADNNSVGPKGLIIVFVFLAGMVASLGVPAVFNLEQGTADRPEILVDTVSGRQIAYSYDDEKKVYYMYDKDVSGNHATVLKFSYREDNTPITDDDKLLSVRTISPDGTILHTDMTNF